MRAFLKALSIVVAVAALQSAVLPHYLEPAFKPDLLLVLMVFLALRAKTSVSLPASYGLGLLKDCLSGMYLGLNAFSFLLVYLVLKSVSERLNVQSCLLFVLTVTAATVASAAINLLLLLVFSQTPTLFTALLNQLLPHLLVNSFVASLVAVFPDCGSLRTSP